MRKFLRFFGWALVAGLAAIGSAAAQDEKGFGKVNEYDPVFLRFPDLRQKYFSSGESTIAKHKFIAMPMPKQCAYFYVDVYSTQQMSNHDTRREATRRCNQNMTNYGSLSQNYATVNCQCELVIGRDTYRLPADQLPTMGYAPVSLYLRDGAGRSTQYNGYAEFSLQFKPGESGSLIVYNASGVPVCNGTISIPGAASGNFALTCGRYKLNGQLVYYRTPVKDHTVGRGTTADGGSIVLVMGLPAGAAQARYGH